MVDFQSRDSGRGYGADADEDDEPQEEAESEAEPEEEAESEAELGEEVAPDVEAATDEEAAAETETAADTETADPGATGASDPLAPSTGGGDGANRRTDAPQSDSVSVGGADGGGIDEEASAAGHPAEPDRAAGIEPGESEGADASPGREAGDEHGERDHGGRGTTHDDHAHAHEGPDHAHAHSHGADADLLGVAVVTVSSTRTFDDDASGDVVEAIVERADHEVVTREIVRDDLDGVQTALLNLTGRDDVDVVVTTGGTGVTPDDVTVEAARPLFDRELPGFGELFRILSYEEVGTRAMVSRATAGMVDGVPVFCLPGSEAAARLGTEELVVAEMGHLVSLARRDD